MILDYGILVAAIFGAVFGSYATLFAYRIPRGESCFGRYFGPKSRCPKCDYIIRTRELIPIINWLFTKGSCNKCSNPIPKLFLFIECSMAILFSIAYAQEGLTELLILKLALYFTLILIFAINYQNDKISSHLILLFLMFIAVYKTLEENSILPTIFISSLSLAFGAIFYKISNFFFPKNNNNFYYTVFIIVSAIFLEIKIFLIYHFLAILILFFIKQHYKEERNLKIGVLLIILFTILSFFKT